MRFLRFSAILAMLLMVSSSATGDGASEAYSIQESGELEVLGVSVEVTPEMRPPNRTSQAATVIGFWVTAVYDDPVKKNDSQVVFLNPTLFPAICGSLESQDQEYHWTNSRGTAFALKLGMICTRVAPGQWIPHLEFSVWVSAIELEQGYIDAVESQRIFDIFPLGSEVRVQNEIHEAAEMLQAGYKLVSKTILVLDLIFLRGSSVAAGRFFLKQVAGIGVDRLIDQGFEYVKNEAGYSSRFRHTGWDVRCRLCGYHFHRESLLDGELLKCPARGCNAEAYLYF